MNSTSLLAQLYPYFKGSQEDVATASLQYIVSSNTVLNKAFTDLILERLCLKSEDTFQYKCQVVGKSDKRERPDMAGYDLRGKEQILCESKFYAALTSNQPNTYIKRLLDEEGLGLVFICPEARIVGLWSEVLGKASKEYEIKEISKECVEIQGIRMGVITWAEALNRLSDTALNNNIDPMDIKELRGYCDKLDSDAFIPFDELDFGIENGIKQRRHARVLDEIVNTLKADKSLEVSTEKLNATPQKTGYNRYFRMKGYNISLEYDTTKWINTDSYVTPYWIKICKTVDGHWGLDDNCIRAMMTIPKEKKDGEYLALVAPCYVTLDIVVDAMVQQIKQYIEVFESIIQQERG